MDNKKFIGVILAAGFSSRAETFKMTLKFGENTVIENTIIKMSKYCSKIIVVGGYKIERLNFLSDKYDFIELIFNENYKDGMYSSVLKGFNRALEETNWENIIFTPGDYPAVRQEVYKRLIDISQHEASENIIIPIYKEKDYFRNGHPIILKKKLLTKNNLTDYGNLREFLYKRKQTHVKVEDKAILKDLDTMEDYKELLNM
jgi:molybdenum cofactor cytidylyltransferase